MIAVRRVSRVRWIETRLLFAPLLMTAVGLLTIILVPRRDLAWTWRDIWPGLAYAAIVALISLSFSLLKVRADQVVFPLTVTLAGIGMLFIQRLGPALAELAPNKYVNLPEKHFIYLCLGLAVFWVTVIFGRGRLHVLRRYKYTALIIGIMLMLATFVFGTPINGSRIWIQVGGMQVQPGELVKILMVIFLAGYLEDHRDLIGSSWQVGFLRLPPLPYLLPMGVMWATSVLVLVVQNDLGSALLFFGIFLVMLYVASSRAMYVVVGLGAFGLAGWFAWTSFDRIGIRVQNWLNPWENPLTSGFQPVQSEYALASGGILGTGLGLGKPWFINEVHTDYVFSAVAEELGLLGAVAVLALTFLLTMRGFAIALRASDGFTSLLATGLTTIIALQTVIIIGGVLRLIPLTGITLPFVSYGGSSLITNFLLVGLLMACSAASARAAPS